MQYVMLVIFLQSKSHNEENGLVFLEDDTLQVWISYVGCESREDDSLSSHI